MNKIIEYNGYFQEEFGITHNLPAVFIDAYPDEDDPEEIMKNNEQVVKLERKVNSMTSYPLEDMKVLYFCLTNSVTRTSPLPGRQHCILPVK